MEEIKKGQQEMQEKISQVTRMVTGLTKGKGIIDDPNPDDPCEQKKLRKNSFGRSEHINVQQWCNFLDKKLKEIVGVNDLGSVDPRELSLVLDVVIPPKFKVPTFEKYDGTKCLENHLATYCHKIAGHTHN